MEIEGIIYCLVDYEYDTYSYTGIGEHDRYYFTTREKAIAFAASMRLQVVRNCTDPSIHATIEAIEVR